MAKRESLQKKDLIKIMAIAGVIIIPLMISLYAVNRELPENETFWYGWPCEKIVQFKDSKDFDRLTDVIKDQFLSDFEKCQSPEFQK